MVKWEQALGTRANFDMINIPETHHEMSMYGKYTEGWSIRTHKVLSNEQKSKFRYMNSICQCMEVQNPNREVNAHPRTSSLQDIEG